jgi:predicted DNA-binding protein (MmcQ/YjbR family)
MRLLLYTLDQAVTFSSTTPSDGGRIAAAMTLDGYNRFCSALPHTARVVQWGGAHVWKVGGPTGKVFAVAWPEANDALHVTFKATEMSYELLKDKPGMRPAPYFASRGMKWLQRTSAATLRDRAFEGYLRESHRLASLNLPKRVQRELGLSR